MKEDTIITERDERGGYIVPLRPKAMTADDWLAAHRSHGDLSTEAGNLVCECGAKFLTGRTS